MTTFKETLALTEENFKRCLIENSIVVKHWLNHNTLNNCDAWFYSNELDLLIQPNRLSLILKVNDIIGAAMIDGIAYYDSHGADCFRFANGQKVNMESKVAFVDYVNYCRSPRGGISVGGKTLKFGRLALARYTIWSEKGAKSKNMPTVFTVIEASKRKIISCHILKGSVILRCLNKVSSMSRRILWQTFIDEGEEFRNPLFNTFYEGADSYKVWLEEELKKE